MMRFDPKRLQSLGWVFLVVALGLALHLTQVQPIQPPNQGTQYAFFDLSSADMTMADGFLDTLAAQRARGELVTIEYGDRYVHGPIVTLNADSLVIGIVAAGYRR
jgi:hypothetical protein